MFIVEKGFQIQESRKVQDSVAFGISESGSAVRGKYTRPQHIFYVNSGLVITKAYSLEVCVISDRDKWASEFSKAGRK